MSGIKAFSKSILFMMDSISGSSWLSGSSGCSYTSCWSRYVPSSTTSPCGLMYAPGSVSSGLQHAATSSEERTSAKAGGCRNPSVSSSRFLVAKGIFDRRVFRDCPRGAEQPVVCSHQANGHSFPVCIKGGRGAQGIYPRTRGINHLARAHGGAVCHGEINTVGIAGGSHHVGIEEDLKRWVERFGRVAKAVGKICRRDNACGTMPASIQRASA